MAEETSEYNGKNHTFESIEKTREGIVKADASKNALNAYNTQDAEGPQGNPVRTPDTYLIWI